MPTSISHFIGTRKKDLLLFFSESNSYVGELGLTFGDNPSYVVGMEKLVQIFTNIFLTYVGSDLADRKLGTELISNIGFNLNTAVFIESIVMEAVSDAENQILAEQLDNTYPLDETLVDVFVNDISRSADAIYIKVSIVSAAGDNYPFIIPYSVGESNGN